MKHIRIFENFNKTNIEKIFENQKWLVIRAKSYEELLSYSDGTGWHIENVDAKYYGGYSSRPNPYRYNDKIYINIDKQSDVKYLFDFDTEKFYDNSGDDDVCLNEFFDKNPDLMNVYGEIVDCSEIVKENDEYWFVVSGYEDFSEYFTVDNRTRSDFIEIILSGNANEIYEYDSSDFEFDESMKVSNYNVELLKMILRLEKLYNNYDYDLNDIKDYDDVTEIIKEYDVEDEFVELKRILRRCVCEAHENADADEAYNRTLDKIYDFFKLLDGTVKWQLYNNKDSLWTKFDSNESAYRAKFIITNFNNCYEDEKIDGDPPYNGYDGDYKDIYSQFDSILPDRLDDYNSDNLDSETIFKYFDKLNNIKENNPDISENDIVREIEILMNSEKYNL